MDSKNLLMLKHIEKEALARTRGVVYGEKDFLECEEVYSLYFGFEPVEHDKLERKPDFSIIPIIPDRGSTSENAYNVRDQFYKSGKTLDLFFIAGQRLSLWGVEKVDPGALVHPNMDFGLVDWEKLVALPSTSGTDLGELVADPKYKDYFKNAGKSRSSCTA